MGEEESGAKIMSDLHQRVASFGPINLREN